MTAVSHQAETPASESQVTYKAEKREDGDIVIGLNETGRFIDDGEDVKVVDGDGRTVEVLENEIKDAEGRSANLTFHQVNDRVLVVSPEGVYVPYGYAGCVGKNTAGGIVGGAAAGCASGAWFGGAGCVPAAGAGAVTGGIATGVGSLIWCA